ncbi:MAG: S8 family serine peptidase [Phycisphaerales bacterium]|nr:MAG: S8 family serine peptidase [Phycisphaerales bacterium]
MSRKPCKASARAGWAVGFGIAFFTGAAMAQTELSLQETELNVTADHSGNQTVNIHLDSVGAHAAVYGIVGRSNGQARARMIAPGTPGPRESTVVQYDGVVDWAAPHQADELIVCYDAQWGEGVNRPNAVAAVRQQKNDLHAGMGATFCKELRSINADVVKVPPGVSLQAMARRYATRPGVTFVQPNYIYKAIGLPDDPNFPFVPSSLGPPDDQLMWGLHTTAQDGASIPSDVAFDSDIDAAEAWEVTTGSSDMVVAVIDTGVDYTHPDIVANMWTNAGEINGNGLDDDGNGFVDDYYGYDFKNDDGDPFDDHYHGTHVAGTIGAVGNNGVNIAGVNWNVRIMALKFLGSDGRGSTSDAVEAIDYAVLMGATISNNSWGGGGFDASLLAAINNAGAAGHLFVAAAGNDTVNTDIYPHYPSSYNLDDIISVAAWGKDEHLAYFSNYGATTTDLAAPGLGIYSLQLGGGIFPLNGTSMAAPHVAGVAALLKVVRPDAGPLQIKEWILDGVTPHPNLTGKVLTGGRLNAVEPLRLATMPWLRVDNREGIIDAAESLTIPVTFVTENVPVGFYSGSLIVLDLSYDNAVTPRIEIPVTMDLQFVELAPIVEDVHQFVVQNVDTTVTLVGRDPNIGQSVDFTIETLPTQGTLIDPATGLPISSTPYALAEDADTVVYSPATDQLYTETFQYTATDGTLTSNLGTVTVEVVAPPHAPEDVSAYSGNIVVELNWLPNVEPDLAGYHIYVSPDSGGPYLKITSSPITSTTYRHYPGGQAPTYYVITAVRDNGAESAFSAEVSGQPTFSSHYAPLNLCATPGYEKVYLEWEAPWEFLGTYRIIRTLHDGGGAEIVGELSDKHTTTFVDEAMQWTNGPENGVTYDYEVENWTYWDLWGSSSNLVTVTPSESTPPTIPTGVSAVGGESFVDVTWDANPELDIDEYWVLRATSLGGPYYYRGSVNDRRYYDLAVAPFTTYYYIIVALDIDGDESDWSEPVSATTGGDTTPPAAPTNLTATPGDGVVFLDWDDNTEPDLMAYFIYRSTTGGGPYEEVDNDDPSQFPDYSVVNGTTYYYVVTAKDIAGNESAFSNEASATPQAPVSCTFDWECDDDTYCNGAETCVTGQCQAGTPVDCDDGIACTNDSCNEATDSCDNIADDAACDDGLFCNGAETCNVTLGCQAGSPVDCDDGVGCTDDSCNEVTDACDNVPDDGYCDDGLFCNGVETCHLVYDCQIGTDPCPGQDCDEGNDVCVPVGCDNDGVCESGEDCNNCSADCISGGGGGGCGNGVCEPSLGEDCLSCPADCNGKQVGATKLQFCCGDGDGTNPVGCDDARCNSEGFSCGDAPPDPYCCGDLVCEGAEDGYNCEIDCGAPPFCGDANCDPGEDQCNCPDDCGFPPATESNCTDGLDEDCDGAADCDDPTGDCDADPACSCLAKGEACSTNEECCSNKCLKGLCK